MLKQVTETERLSAFVSSTLIGGYGTVEAIEQYGKKGRKDVTCAKKMILLQATMLVRTCGGSKVVPFNRVEQSESEEEAVVIPAGEIDIPNEDDSKNNEVDRD